MRKLKRVCNEILKCKLQQRMRKQKRGVDAFLDWNFSLAGQYAQLVYLAGASVSQASFADYLSGKMNGFIREPLTPALLAAQQHLNGNVEVEVQRAGASLSAYFQSIRGTNCLFAITGFRL